MNSLSLLLYLAGVVGNLSAFLTIIVVLLALLQLGIIVAYTIEKEKMPPVKLWICAAIAIPLGIMTSFIPNKETIMYITASEYGEKFVNSKEVQDLKNPAVDLLKQWMKKESDRLTKETK